MKLSSSLISSSILRRTAVAAAIAAVSVGASAQTFTLNPAGVNDTSAIPTPLAGASFTGDNILISDYSTVRLSGTTFTDSGYLAISGIELNGQVLTSTATPGLNSTYGLYIAFEAAGTTTAGDPTLVPTSGTFTSLTYQLYGYNGAPATFAIGPGNVPTENATGEVLLASGSLISGGVATIPVAGGRLLPFAGADVTFSVEPSAGGFFVSPSPFYGLAFAAFSNTTSQVTAFAGGFSIDDGGGAFNFAPIPEPETYALMLAGLGVVGFVARRRRS